MSVALPLTVAEVYLRNTTFRPNRRNQLFQYDATLGWRFTPRAEEWVNGGDYARRVQVNSSGFHDSEPPREAETRQRLVAVLGDSFTSNIGVAVNEVFTSVMNAKLGPHTITKNFGVNGYGQVQELLLLDEVLERQRTDVVLLVVYWRNDLDDNGGQFDWIRNYRRPKAERTREGLKVVTGFPEPSERTATTSRSLTNRVRSLALVQSIKRVMGRADVGQVPRAVLPPEFRYGTSPLAGPEAEAVEVTKMLFDRLAARASESHVPLGFVFAPSLWQVESERWTDLLEQFSLDPTAYSRSQPQGYLLEHCALRGLKCLDLQPVLQQHAAVGETLYYPNETHWTEDGNALVADAISAWLTKEQFLRQSGPGEN